MRWFWVLALVALGCAGGVDQQSTSVSYELIVDSEWSPEQTEEILDGVDFWRAELGEWVQIAVAVGPCDESTRGCVAAVDSDAADLAEGARRNEQEMAAVGEDLRVVGVTTHTAIVLDRNFSRIGDLFRHELGHRLGLLHSDGGVMEICVGSSEITPAVRKRLALRGLR